jgi:hypothetical protein
MNTKTCTNQIKELMKQLTLISRTYQNTKKQNDVTKDVKQNIIQKMKKRTP